MGSKVGTEHAEGVDIAAIGVRIKSLRAERNWSLRRLAARAELSHTHIGQMENGEIPEPSLVKVARLAVALEVSLSELLGDAWERRPRPADRHPLVRRINEDLSILQEQDARELETIAVMVGAIRGKVEQGKRKR